MISYLFKKQPRGISLFYCFGTKWYSVGWEKTECLQRKCQVKMIWSNWAVVYTALYPLRKMCVFQEIHLSIRDAGSVQKVSSHVLWKIETFIEEDTRYKKHYTQDNDSSVPFKVGTSGPHTLLPIAISCTIIFSWISLMVWNLFLFKGDFGFGKSQKLRGTKFGLQCG